MDLARLTREVERFDPSLPIEAAWTPPRSWYVDPDFLALEERSTFARHWVALCRSEQVAEHEAFATGRVGSEPIVAVRGTDGVLRAFHNVCRHHAALVAHGEGCARELVCPYHGWTYALDGSLKSAPRLGAVVDFDRADFGLPEVACEEWMGFVFVHLGTPARSLADELAPLTARLDAVDTRALQFVERRRYELACNWKVFADNYLDGGYHVPHLHRQLAAELDLDGYRTELFERFSVQSCGGRDPERIGGGALYAWLYPTLALNRYGPVLDTNLVRPLAHDRTEVVFDFFFADVDGPEARAFIEQSTEETEQVQAEDVWISEVVQRGLGSRSYDRGRYAPGLEGGEHHFHRLLAEDYRAGLSELAEEEDYELRRPAAPPAGRTTVGETEAAPR